MNETATNDVTVDLTAPAGTPVVTKEERGFEGAQAASSRPEERTHVEPVLDESLLIAIRSVPTFVVPSRVYDDARWAFAGDGAGGFRKLEEGEEPSRHEVVILAPQLRRVFSRVRARRVAKAERKAAEAAGPKCRSDLLEEISALEEQRDDINDQISAKAEELAEAIRAGR